MTLVKKLNNLLDKLKKNGIIVTVLVLEECPSGLRSQS